MAETAGDPPAGAMAEPAGDPPVPEGTSAPPPTSDPNQEAWKAFARSLLDALALNATIVFSRPTLTMGVFVPAAFVSGSFGIVSAPFGCLLCAGLIGLAYLSDQRHKLSALERERSLGAAFDGASFVPLWDDPAAPAAGDGKEAFRKRAESVEWLNQFVRHCWLRYPRWVGDWWWLLASGSSRVSGRRPWPRSWRWRYSRRT